MTEPNVDLWPGVNLTLRDKERGWEIPLTVVLDEPLSFELPDHEPLSEEQLAEILQVACSQDSASIGVTETFGAVMDCISKQLATIPSCVEDDQNRLGQMLAITALFDDGVAAWCEHWRAVLSCSELTEYGRSALDRKLLRQIAENTEFLVRKHEDSELKGTIAELEKRPFLTLEELRPLTGRYPGWFRTQNLLHDLGTTEGIKDLEKLNGIRDGKGSRPPWRFEQSEVQRFIKEVFRPMWQGIDPGDAEPGVQIRAPRA